MPIPQNSLTEYNVDPNINATRYPNGINSGYIEQQVTLTTLPTNADTELESYRADVTLSQFSGVGVAGMSYNVQTAGSNGAWGNGIFASITEGTAGSSVHGTTGYISAAEFSTRMKGTWNAFTAAVITLNAVDNRTAGTPFGTAFAYILLRQYGSIAANNCKSLFSMFDQTVVAGSTGHGSTLLESAADTAATHYVHFSYGNGGTSLWLLATTTAPS
jgi:hypothetical protein